MRTLAELDSVRKLDEYDPEEVGLDSPRGRVVVELADGKKKELLIGSEVPGSGNLIVAVEGEQGASVVAGSLWESVDKDAAAWRDPDLFAPEREDVIAMTLEHGAPDAASTVRLTRAGEDFELASPIRDRADADGVNALLRELIGLRASEFLDAPPPLQSIGLDPPRARLTVELQSGEPLVLLWGARKEGSQESWAKTANWWSPPRRRSTSRSSARFRLALERVVVDAGVRGRRVTVADAQGTLELTRAEGSWKRDKDAIEYGPVSDLLYAIDDAKAERIAEPAEAAAIGQPEITVTFAAVEEVGRPAKPTPNGESPAAAGKTERLELYAPTAENLVPVRTDGRQAVLLLKRETRDQISAKLQAVRDAKPPTEEPPPALGQDPAEE